MCVCVVRYPKPSEACFPGARVCGRTSSLARIFMFVMIIGINVRSIVIIIVVVIRNVTFLRH